MRVVQAVDFGGPEVLVPGETPDPVAGPGQVVVEVSVAGITFVETQIRRGVDKWHAKPELPYVPGGLVAGRVASLGEGVESSWLGRRVLADTGETGGFAERAVADVGELIPVPEGLGLPEAAALHTDGSTALGLVEAARVRSGEWVLVEAAAGGVGSMLVQLARLAGAKVVGAARGARKLDLVRELGAEAVVDYSEPDWTEQVLKATDGVGPDVVFDGVGGPTGQAAFEVTARNGRFSIHGASSGRPTVIEPAQAELRGVEVIGLEQLFGFGPKMGQWAEQMMAEAAAGRIRPVIGQTYPLERAADAHAAIETRSALGKTLLLI
ncbi:zinc-binding dehydrogenase [Actinomadura rudentiformis]|uniref:Zinc-binding dehydrogenase n=1 Tax=Actinomadura rudentiformis TaxID=359158 RepID=A0A6H9YLU1_9ACTN|nr:zinc-binding dehydrogenase [Actinomadura rudentiformis]KAB2340526.1 zinc-binding dehydrogenase [Actinomadura rudentiformis]